MKAVAQMVYVLAASGLLAIGGPAAAHGRCVDARGNFGRGRVARKHRDRLASDAADLTRAGHADRAAGAGARSRSATAGLASSAEIASAAASPQILIFSAGRFANFEYTSSLRAATVTP